MRLASLMALLIGCSPAEIKLIGAPPPEIDLIAGLTLGPDGALLGASGLVPADEAASVLISTEVDAIENVMAIGFSEADILSVSNGKLPSPRTLARAPIFAVGPDSPALPPPRWRAEGTVSADGVASLTVGGPSLLLSADWVAPCPSLFDRLPLLAPCDGAYCGHIARQEGCTLEVNLESCVENGPSTLQVLSQGLVVGGSEPHVCSSVERPEDAAFSVLCGECRVDAWAPPFTVPFEVTQTITVVAPPDPEARASEAAIANFGYVVDIALASPEACGGAAKLIALTRATAGGCGASPELVRVDVETGMIDRRQNILRGCPRALIADPVSAELLLVLDDPVSVVRVDCELQTIGSDAYPSLEGPDTTVAGAALVPLPSPAEPRLVLALADEGADVRIAEIELATRTELRTTTIDWRFVNSMVAFGSTGVAVGVLRSRETAFDAILVMDLTVDPPSPPLSTAAQAVFDSAPSDTADALLVFGDPPLLGVSSAARDDLSASALRIGEPNSMFEKTLGDYTEPNTAPSALHYWRAAPTRPATRGHLLVATTDARLGSPPITKLGLVDVDAGRYLPGRIPIGFGPAKQMIEDADGDIWIALAWQGTIVRVHPTEPRLVPP